MRVEVCNVFVFIVHSVSVLYGVRRAVQLLRHGQMYFCNTISRYVNLPEADQTKYPRLLFAVLSRTNVCPAMPLCPSRPRAQPTCPTLIHNMSIQSLHRYMLLYSTSHTSSFFCGFFNAYASETEHITRTNNV